MKCSKGMCATLLNVVGANDATRKRVEGAVNGLAAHGLRALGVAICNVEEDCKDVWQFIAVMPIYDPPREDTADTIAKAIQLGVSVKMLTGGAFHCRPYKPLPTLILFGYSFARHTVTATV